MADLASLGLVVLPAQTNNPAERRTQLRLVEGDVFVAWVQIMIRKSDDVEIETIGSSRFHKRPELTPEQHAAAKTWVCEKLLSYFAD